MADRCEQRAYNATTRRFLDCGNKVKVVVDGRGYCGIHNPDRQAYRDRKGRLQYAVKNAQWEREGCVRRLGEAVLKNLKETGRAVLMDSAPAAAALESDRALVAAKQALAEFQAGK